MEGQAYPMVGWLHGRGYRTKKLSRFGYVELLPKDGGPCIRGHEFHYFDTSDNGSDFLAKKPFREESWRCIHAENGLAGFPHLYYESAPDFLVERLNQWILHREKNYE
jgi:cobyrinic acid a,c-diamide synthase